MQPVTSLTKRAIRASFLKLLNERPLNKITVKDIVEDCGINRNSFYYHYPDIPALAEEIVRDEAARIVQEYPTGANVSGGQKQRLSIARALARKPEILIFDDSFSALDYRTDASLRAGLARELSDTTCLIVAQRIGTIRHADRIVVLDEGRVAGIGTHDELMKNCSVYREIAMSQLSAAELEKEGV